LKDHLLKGRYEQYSAATTTEKRGESDMEKFMNSERLITSASSGMISYF
jgi:hypothetical protein